MFKDLTGNLGVSQATSKATVDFVSFDVHSGKDKVYLTVVNITATAFEILSEDGGEVRGFVGEYCVVTMLLKPRPRQVQFHIFSQGAAKTNYPTSVVMAAYDDEPPITNQVALN